MTENKFERVLWNTRFIVLISVILSIISSIILFILGGWDIIQAIIYNNPIFNENINSNNDILFKIISSIDLFLIGIVLLRKNKMPFKSKKQRAYLYATNPKVAKEFEKKTPKNKKLPNRSTKKRGTKKVQRYKRK